MADENYGAVLGGHNASCHLDIVGQRNRGILDNTNRETFLAESSVHRLPTRAVHEAAMDEINKLRMRRRVPEVQAVLDPTDRTRVLMSTVALMGGLA